uniref:Mitochondrial proton/calcium exchanger protein n=1 Tax=Timema shepardi TaxID=629360 RepID=A0A7R9ANK9_TIMSH|nr:unnamed protein product [Timema shepardi]
MYGSTRYDTEPFKSSSKVEDSVKALKEDLKECDKPPPVEVKVKKSLKQKIVDEVVHYYHGFRLLFIDINISRKLLWRVLNGKTLTRREHNQRSLVEPSPSPTRRPHDELSTPSKKCTFSLQLVRTVGDLFRLVPFSVFVIVPFMELLLPLAIKFFPGMLPSTFQTVTEKVLALKIERQCLFLQKCFIQDVNRLLMQGDQSNKNKPLTEVPCLGHRQEDKMKQALKVKLEMAKFLQKTLDEMAVEGKGHRSEAAKEFADFVTKLRSSGQKATNKEILKFSKLFKDELTLDSLTRPQLVALCRVLELQPIGTINFLRFQLRMKLRSLAADDKVMKGVKMIQKEGVDSLTPWELQQACRARGMRAYGMSEAGLRNQLEQWLDLSLNEKVPPSLLLLSRALLLPDTVSTADQLKATISVLPDTVVNRARAVIGEREGKIDNKTKIDLICEEEKRINEERLEETEEEQKRLERKCNITDHVEKRADSSQGIKRAGEGRRAMWSREGRKNELWGLRRGGKMNDMASGGEGRREKCQSFRKRMETTDVAWEVKELKEILKDKAPILRDEAPEILNILSSECPSIEGVRKKDLSSIDLEALEDALDTLGKDKKKLIIEKEELDTLKEEMEDYKEVSYVPTVVASKPKLVNIRFDFEILEASHTPNDFELLPIDNNHIKTMKRPKEGTGKVMSSDGMKPRLSDLAVMINFLQEAAIISLSSGSGDVQDLNQVMLNADKSTEMKESKAARRLFKKVSGMIHKMDAVLSELEQEEEQLKRDLKEEIGTKEQDVEKKSEELVTIEELIASIKQIQKIPDESLVNRIAEVLEQMDVDKDGAIRVDHVLKVLEVVGKENVKLNKKQMDELLDLLKKEEVIELEDQIAKALEKESMDHDLQSSLKENSVFNEKKDSVVTKTPTNSSEAMKVSPLPLSAPASSPTMSAISPANCNKTIDEPKEKKDNSKTL